MLLYGERAEWRWVGSVSSIREAELRLLVCWAAVSFSVMSALRENESVCMSRVSITCSGGGERCRCLRRRRKRARRRRAAKETRAPMAMPTLAPVERPPWDLEADATRVPVAEIPGVIVGVIVPEGVFEMVAAGAVVSGVCPTTETAGVYIETDIAVVGITEGVTKFCRGARSRRRFVVGGSMLNKGL
jgi:hypothetical protein